VEVVYCIRPSSVTNRNVPNSPLFSGLLHSKSWCVHTDNAEERHRTAQGGAGRVSRGKAVGAEALARLANVAKMFIVHHLVAKVRKFIGQPMLLLAALAKLHYLEARLFLAFSPCTRRT
jgi:hypothetical protein